MKKLICAVWLAVLLSSAVYADDPAGIRVETLAKTSSSWDGTPMPAYLLSLTLSDLICLKKAAGCLC